MIRVNVTASNTSGADATRASSATDEVIAASSEVLPGASSGSGAGTNAGSPGRPGVQPISDTRPVGGYLPGVVTATVGGTPTAVSTTSDPATGGVSVQGPDFALSLTPQSTVQPAGSSPRVGFTTPQGGSIDVNGTGYLPGTTVTAFLIPEEVRNTNPAASATMQTISVGSADVLSDGTIRLRVDVPQQTEVGAYVLQVNGINTGLQVRTVNIGMDVTLSVPVARTTTVIKTAFFLGRSADFSKVGKRKLRQAVAAIPAGSSDMRLNVMAVAVSQSSAQADRQLATKRARAIIAFLEERGVSGATSIQLLTSANVDKAKRAEFQRSSDGHPLSTVKLTFVPASGG